MLALPYAAAADARFGIEVDLGRDSNVNRAADLRRADEFVDLEGYAARSFQTGYRSGLVLRAALRGREYFAYSDLSNIGLSGRVAWRIQPTPGYSNPWFEAAFSAEGLRFRDSAIRDGAIVSATVSAGSWFTDRLRGVAGAGYDHRIATEGEVYDLKNPKLWASIDWRATDALTVYGTGTLIDGQQVVTVMNWTGSAWTGGYSGASYSAWARDPVFARGNERFTAYRVDARTTVLELGLHWAVTGTQAIDVSATRYAAKADNGPTYDGYLVRAGWIYRFR